MSHIVSQSASEYILLNTVERYCEYVLNEYLCFLGHCNLVIKKNENLIVPIFSSVNSSASKKTASHSMRQRNVSLSR